jgi:hypothetical protein
VLTPRRRRAAPALQLMGMSSAALTSRMLTDMQLLEADAGVDT